jgi:hypothetical protein
MPCETLAKRIPLVAALCAMSLLGCAEVIEHGEIDAGLEAQVDAALDFQDKNRPTEPTSAFPVILFSDPNFSGDWDYKQLGYSQSGPANLLSLSVQSMKILPGYRIELCLGTRRSAAKVCQTFVNNVSDVSRVFPADHVRWRSSRVTNERITVNACGGASSCDPSLFPWDRDPPPGFADIPAQHFNQAIDLLNQHADLRGRTGVTVDATKKQQAVAALRGEGALPAWANQNLPTPSPAVPPSGGGGTVDKCANDVIALAFDTVGLLLSTAFAFPEVALELPANSQLVSTIALAELDSLRNAVAVFHVVIAVFKFEDAKKDLARAMMSAWTKELGTRWGNDRGPLKVWHAVRPVVSVLAQVLAWVAAPEAKVASTLISLAIGLDEVAEDAIGLGSDCSGDHCPNGRCLGATAAYVRKVRRTRAPRPPPGWSVDCHAGTNTFDRSGVCDVLFYRGLSYWAFSHYDNRFAMLIVAYDGTGRVVGMTQRNGARYHYKTQLNTAGDRVTFFGQANRSIQLTLSDLPRYSVDQQAWSRSVSEEGDNLTICGENRANTVVTGFSCAGSYCDNVRLLCGRTSGNDKLESRSVSWTSRFSEEGANSRTCPGNSFMTGLRCTGSNCDNLELRCTDLGVTRQSCRWTDWVSEENGGTLQFSSGDYAAGVQCRGSRCDDKQFFVCKSSVALSPSTGWSRWVSEEQGGTLYCGEPFTSFDSVVAGARCSGANCDNISLLCARDQRDRSPSHNWTGAFSDEGNNQRICSGNKYVNGLQCTGGYCDNLNLRCADVAGWGRSSCYWTDWLSEENGGQLAFRKNYYLAGVQCRGRYCDDKRFYACTPDPYGSP